MIFCNLCANTTGFGRYTVYLVKKAQPPAHFDTEYSALSKWECQNWEVVHQEAMLQAGVQGQRFWSDAAVMGYILQARGGGEAAACEECGIQKGVVHESADSPIERKRYSSTQSNKLEAL